ncbi:MAG TPA: gluconokinase [Ktedonobacterales bacterium]|nr:gluconokinase [Ktedonobacterales bacterium]
MAPSPCVVGLDLGTSSVKAAAFAEDGSQIVAAAEQLAQRHDEPGAAEQDPEVVYQATMRALAAVGREAAARGHRVALVGISAAMHSLIPVAADGQPLAPAMLWMDTRAGPLAEQLRATPQGTALYARTGTPIHAMAPLAKLLWLRAKHPDRFGAAARFVSLKEWLWHRWWGAWEVDASVASATGLYAAASGMWDAEALRVAAIGPERLSTLVPTTAIRQGITTPDLLAAGFSPATRWNIGASDGALANLAVDALDGQRLAITIGTSLAVRIGSAMPVVEPVSQIFSYVLAEGRYVVGGASNNGGVLLDWLFRDVLGGASAADGPLPPAFNALVAAAGATTSDGLVCLPYVAGERAPLWDAGARGVLAGLSLSHSQPQIMRAAIEGSLLNARWIAEPLLKRRPAPHEVVATGRLLEEPWIRQLAADIFDLPVRLLGDVDASLVGAAKLARIAAGEWSWERNAYPPGVAAAQTSTPQDAARYRDLYARFRRLAAAIYAQ